MILVLLPNLEHRKHEEKCRGKYTHKKYHNSNKI